MLAYILHPKSKGDKLCLKEKQNAEQYMFQTYPETVADYVAFLGQTQPFPETRFCPQAVEISPARWWASLRNSNVHEDLEKLAIRLYNCPVSSASSEMIFSNFGMVHSKLRNRLGGTRCAQLVFCYRQLLGSSQNESDEDNWKN